MHQSKKTFFYLLIIGAAIGLTAINCVLFLNRKGTNNTSANDNTADSVVGALERTYFQLSIKYADLAILKDLSVSDSLKEYTLPDFLENYISLRRHWLHALCRFFPVCYKGH